MADVGLLAALRTLGVSQVTSNSNESSFDVTGDSTLNASTPETAVPSPTQKGVQLGRAELLRATHQLVDGLLRLQSKASSQAPSYLSLVLPCLFKLLNDPHQDVRIAADEGINKLIKLLRVSMTHQVIFELFLELKRNANARTVTVALNKFSGLVHRIRASKRRFYTLNLLPVLVTICERDDESVFDVLSEHFGQIASQLFCHATERELVDFLRRQLVRLSSETALIRRSVAQTLVLTCQYSRVPLTLFRLLLQRILRRSTVVSFTRTPVCNPCDLGGTERPPTNVAAGLLSTLRYLSIAWQQVLRSNPAAVEQEAKRASSANLRVRTSAMGPSEPLTSEITPNKVVRSELETDDPRLTSSDSRNQNSAQYTNELDDRQWSQAFFTCLDYANTSSITLSTAALEALSQFLIARRPSVLFPRQWLSGTTTNWSTNMLENPSDQTSVADAGIEDVFCQGELTFHPFEHTDSIREGPIRDSALDGGPPFPDSWHHVDGGAPTLSRSVSSSSIASSLDADPELHQARQDVQKQLSMVRARMAREEQTSSVVQETGSHSDTNLSAEDYSVLGSVADSSDPSVIMLKGASSGSGSDNISQGKPTSPLKLLTLTELLTYLVPEEPSSLRESTWLVSYLMLQFRVLPDTVTGPLALLPRSPTNPRTCNQLLAIACLTQIASCCPNQFFRPISLSQFCALDSMEAETPTSYPSTVDILLRLLHTHSDPQLRGQVCVLLGQLISACLVHDSLLECDGSAVLTNPYDVLLSAIDRVLSSSAESSGTTYRLALSGLRSCVNAVLAVPRRDSAAPSLLETDLASFVMNCVARNLAPAARHSYRLVRREFLLLVNDLNWNAINFWETIMLNPAASDRLNCLARPQQLMDLAWTETWRLLSDPESELSELAAATLVYTLSDILPNDSRNGFSNLLECSVERRLHYWYPSFYSSARLPIMSSGLLDCWDSQIFPPCMSGLPMELDVGPSGLHSLPLCSRLLYAESMDIGSGGQRESLALTGSLRLFRQCVTGLLELPCASLLPEDRYMLHGIVRCLNRLIGQTHVMALAELWYTPAETINPKNDSSEDFYRQRRPRMALLSWQCLTLLSAAPLTTIDLDLHVDLLYLCTGCLTRWALHSLTEGSISLGAQSMSLDLQHAYTRFCLSLLHHVARVLFILWHVVEEIQPSPVPPSSAHADPFHPDSPLSIALQLSRRLHPDTTGPMVNESQAIPGKLVSSDSSTSGRTARRPISAKLASPLKKAQQETAVTESRRILGYFSHIPHYMSLYQALKVAFQNFKISPDLTGSQDRLMNLLQAYLHTLSRLMCNLRLAETAPYSDELLTYVAVLYHCHPAACLEASTQILRAFVGTNLISHWDEQLAKLYNVALSPGLSSSTSFDPRPEPDTADKNELTKSVETPDSEKLWTRYVNYTSMLASPTTDVTPFASWLGLDQLVRTPITAWIRFARQWRVPLPLTSKNSVIRVELFHLLLYTPLSHFCCQTELTQFFKRFEHIVIQSMEEYKWTTCPHLQSGILNLLTHLVCLQLNYEQLDTGLEFLQTVMKHCENLSLDIHRQQMSPLGSARKRSALDEPWWAFCSGLPTFTPATTTGRVTHQSHQHQSLVNAIFRFLVTLAYQKQHSSKSNRGLEPQAELTGTTVTSAIRPPAFAQVMHMAETLAAEDLDPGSTVLSALVPIVVDLYVIQRPLISSSVPSHLLEEKAEDPVFKQAEVAREAAFNFFLRRLAHLPASYDQLCLILEEATLLQLGPSDVQEKRLSNVLSQVVDVVVTHLTDGTMQICTRDDLSSILRICDHIIIALSDCKSTHLANIRLALDRVLRVTLSVTDKLSVSDLIILHHLWTNFSVQWAVAQVCCIRLHLRLLALLRGHAPSSPTNTASDPIRQLAQLLSRAFHVLRQLVLAVHQLLVENPRLATSLNKLTLEDGDTAGVLLQLVCQLTLTHFLTVIELTDCWFFLMNEGAPASNFPMGVFKSVHSLHPTENPLLAGMASWPSQHQLGVAEVLIVFWVCRRCQRCQGLITPFSSGFIRDANHLIDFNFVRRPRTTTLSLTFVFLLYLTAIRSASHSTGTVRAIISCALDPSIRPEHKLLSTELIRLLDLWHSDVSPVVQLLDELVNCPTGGSQLLSYLSQSVPFMTVVQLRTMLRLLSRQERRSHINQRLAILWDHFIAPRPEVPSSVNECSTCRRPSLPLGLQLSAIREASRLFRLLLESEKVDKIMLSNVSTFFLTLFGFHFYSDCTVSCCCFFSLPPPPALHVGPTGYTNGLLRPSSQNQRPPVVCARASGSNVWLPDLAQVLLRQPSCHSHIRGAVRLLQALPDTDATAVQRLTSVLRACCSRCYPTLIYFSLVFHSYPRSRHVVCEEPTTKTSQPHTDHTICVTPQLGSLFRTAQQILFDRIQTIVSEPNYLRAVDFDPGLDTSMQCELIGLATGLVHFLQIVPELPAVDVVPMETETVALRFLCVLIEFVLQSLCCDPHESVGSRKSHRSRGCSFSLVQITLELMDRVLQTIPKRLVKGVDVLGDGADQLLTQFVTFFAAVDKFAGLSVPLTYWTLNDHPQLHTRNSTLEDATTATLLVPKYPSLFGSWFQYTQPASIIATFTSVGTAASASVCLAGGDDTFGGRSLLQSAIAERVPPCQVLNKCRLLRSFCVPGMDWSLSGRLNMCLIGCIRLLTLRTSLCSAKESQPSETLEVGSMLGLEHESIAATISRFGALAWTDRRQFETMWTSFLELLDPYGLELGGSAPPDSDNGADVELIERNQCVELGFHGLTRLLLDATLRPQPGDPVHSRLCHHPRIATPQFLHTRLGQKLNGLVTLIECERLRCSRFPNVALRSLNSCSVATDFVGVLGHVTTASADLVACLVEPNIERLCDPPGTAGLSQFSISWLVRRLQPSPRTNLTAIGSELKTDLLDLADSAPVSPSSPCTSEGRVVTDYDEVLFSCLQSSQLLFQSWLRPANATQSTGSQSGSEQTMSGPHISGYSDSATTVGAVSAVQTSVRSDPTQAKRGSTGQTTKPGYPALAVSSALVRSVVILSDLFTTREQFEWLQGYLSEFVGKLPSLSDFPAPIQQWLTIGLAKSSAVLEVAASGPENMELLQPGSLDLAVRQTLMALQSNQITLQNAGLQAAMWLLHAALLVRAQPHQSQLQQHSPPTGSPVLNELYSQLCSYLERKLDALFGPLRSIRSSAAEYTDSSAVDSLKTTRTDRPVAELDKTAGASSGLKRFMTGMFGVSAGSKTGVIGAASHVKPFDATTFSVNASNGNSFQTERVERHQLTILAAAFFLAENFSAPPVHPVLTDFGSGLTEMLSGLTSNLFRLGSFMLSDSVPSTLLGTRSLHTPHAALGTGTTAHLCCSLLVHTAWCRGIGRLVMMGRLGKGATESLQKLCVTRLRACRSPLISLPVLRLLVTCMYANAGRLNHQLKQYRHASSLMGTVPTDDTESSMMNSGLLLKELTSFLRTLHAHYFFGPHPALIATSDDIPLTRKSLTLPPSVVVDSEAAVGMTQEFLSCLWERLRGGIAPVLASPSNSTSTWISSAWTSAVEATVVADLLPSTSMDIIQALSVSYPTSNQDADYEKQRDEHISDPVLNKALGEFARLDHANPQLAAQTLAQLFGRFLDNEEGQALIRQRGGFVFPAVINYRIKGTIKAVAIHLNLSFMTVLK
ncbi:huntingtin [Clonorchis sinensis]|uniref:Huntingtin n=1 Tax=Clonorchis sinensis TaxID=79923 RepID=G7YU75_CLOSI|nr:huntingtin [Clonorchis sinensis]